MARRLIRLWPFATVMGVIAVVLLIEVSPAWRGLHAALLALDFDSERAWLIEAWLAGATVAFFGALVTGRAWLSSALAVGFVGLSYVAPMGARLISKAPSLFGVQDGVAVDALAHNQLVALAMSFLVAVPFAATGYLLSREIRPLLRGRPFMTRALRPAALLAALAASAALAPSVEPLLRIGPEAGVYQPGPQLPHSAGSTGNPSTSAEIVPTAGQVLRLTYHSQAMGEERNFNLYLPPTYGLKSALRRRYPTLYLLHGDPSGPNEWLNYGTPAIFDAGFVRGDLPETIVVMPDGNGRVTAATQWANRWDGQDRIEDALLELVAVVDREYRTMADRQYRLIGGLSSGAFGAVNIAARHPDLFGVAMGFSGYYFARGPVFGSDAAYINDNSPIVLIQRSPAARSVHYILAVGAADHYRAYMDQFAQQLRRFGVSYDSTVVPGGHEAQVWIDGLVYSLGVIETQLAIPANDHQSRDERLLSRTYIYSSPTGNDKFRWPSA